MDNSSDLYANSILFGVFLPLGIDPVADSDTDLLVFAMSPRAAALLNQAFDISIVGSDLVLGIYRSLFSAASDVRTLVLPLASSMFARKGCWSIFIGF